METTFVYLVEGEPHVGTIADYAKAVENAHYAGIDVDGTVWTFEAREPVAHEAKVTPSDYDQDDYATLTVQLELDEDAISFATVRIDGRA